ncbi:MAG: sigma-54-dependent Fis family transcriptional regulator [Myxococcales bacterium]|nr:sigma-54-dependent Fis family transcriptional regulator [Myxococcales bacterium]
MAIAILVVDDEQDFVDSVSRGLRLEGYSDVTAVTRSSAVPALLDAKRFDCALLDVTMPELDGLALLKLIKERSPETECIMVTAQQSIPVVVRALRLGAYDYLLKPTTPEELCQTLERALERRRLLEALQLRGAAEHAAALADPGAFAEFVTADPHTLRVLREAELHAGSRIPILITGETGVGKEVLARAIHRASPCAAGPFLPINMLAVAPTLFEAEFFGHAKGAFTGADRDRPGYLARAKNGTLFLDEIGDLSLDSQGKLLRILQEGEYLPVGKTRAERAEVRIVAATNQDLPKLVATRKFRKDLLYRLQFAHLELPPLRRRREDIPLLAARLLAAAGHAQASLSERAELALLGHAWPGNVRELKGVLEAAANLAEGGVIEPEHLRLRGGAAPPVQARGVPVEVGQLEPLAAVERRHILAVYDAVGRNKSQAARVLEIGLQTLHRKLQAYDVR